MREGRKMTRKAYSWGLSDKLYLNENALHYSNEFLRDQSEGCSHHQSLLGLLTLVQWKKKPYTTDTVRIPFGG